MELSVAWKINLKDNRDTYRQRADELEHWLLAQSKPDTRTIPRHAPVIKRNEGKNEFIDTNFNAAFLLTHYLYIFYLQRPDSRAFNEERLETLVGNKCHPVGRRGEGERNGNTFSASESCSVERIHSELHSNYVKVFGEKTWNKLWCFAEKSLKAKLRCVNYLSTVNIWSSLTRTHETDLFPSCFTWKKKFRRKSFFNLLRLASGKKLWERLLLL